MGFFQQNKKFMKKTSRSLAGKIKYKIPEFIHEVEVPQEI